MADPGTLRAPGAPTPSPPIILSWTWADAATISLLTCLATLFFPNLRELHKQLFGRRLHRRVRWLAAILDPDMSVIISEYDGASVMEMRRRSSAYEDARAYIGDARSRGARHLRAEPATNAADKVMLSMVDEEEVADEFRGATVWWSAHTQERRDNAIEREFKLHYQERHRELVLDHYLPHIRCEGRAILVKDRQRKIYTNTLAEGRHRDDGWTSPVAFNHPKTFNTLAMEPKMKKEIMDDLDTFKNGKKYYEHIGKPWKRGYLLYGPPGTGKSTMIAAMANFLDYDVYDIELTSVRSNTDLRKLLIRTESKSIIVIEDIDCSLDITGAREKTKPTAATNVAEEKNKATSSGSEVTLSGVLNFIDGLWSACGEERIIVFTSNHIKDLDKALIRRGRMDMHIEMPYCGFEAFKFLANLYLNVQSHKLFGDIEELLGAVEMTPADVAENLMRKRGHDDPGFYLAGLLGELEKFKEAKATE